MNRYIFGMVNLESVVMVNRYIFVVVKDTQKRPPQTRRPPSEKTTKDQMTREHQMVFVDVFYVC